MHWECQDINQRGNIMINTRQIYSQHTTNLTHVGANRPVTSPSAANGQEARGADNVTISVAGQNADSKMKEIGSKYDITNMSTDERAALSQELRDNQLISNDVMLFMMAPLSMNEDTSQKVNYLELMRDSFEFASRTTTDPEQLEIQRQHLHVLEQLSGIAKGDLA